MGIIIKQVKKVILGLTQGYRGEPEVIVQNLDAYTIILYLHDIFRPIKRGLK